MMNVCDVTQNMYTGVAIIHLLLPIEEDNLSTKDTTSDYILSPMCPVCSVVLLGTVASYIMSLTAVQTHTEQFINTTRIKKEAVW